MKAEDIMETSRLAVDLLKTYLETNPVSAEELPNLIILTRKALTRDLMDTPRAEFATPPVPGIAASDGTENSPLSAERSGGHLAAVTLEASLASPKVIISMINGKPYKSLKSHITRAGLTPEIYRARYGLPHDYPMTAPEYSKQRSAAAIRLGYGRKPNQKNKPRTPALPANATSDI